MKDWMQLFKSVSNVTNAFQTCKWANPSRHLYGCIRAIQAHMHSVQQELFVTNLTR